MIMGCWGIGRRKSPSLPYDARVLYVASDGIGSFFNTGIVPDYTSVVHVTAQNISSPRESSSNLISNPLFGAASGSGIATGNLQVVVQTGNNMFKPYQPSLGTGVSGPHADHDIHDIVLGSGKFTFDGDSFSVGTISSTRTFGEFCLGSRGTVDMTGSTAGTGFTGTRFYSCRIYTGGMLVFDGIPVRKNRKGYIYDRVSGRLCGNAGAAGTSVTYGADVPFDEYVEYLESTGTQYIDTGVVATAGIGFTAIGRASSAPSTGTYPVLAGWMDGDWSEYNALYSGEAGLAEIECRNACYISLSVGEETFKAVVPQGTSAGSVAGLYGLESGTSSTDTMAVGAEASSNGVHLAAFGAITSDGPAELTQAGGRLYRYVISDPSSVLRNFAPVRIGSVGYLYDRANPTGGPLGNGLYPKAGTGDFVLGPDISPPYDARVLYVETDGVGSYVDTGIIPVLVGDSESRVHVEFSLPVDPPSGNASVYGARYAGGTYISSSFACITVNSSAHRIQFLRPTITTTSPLTPIDHDIHSVDLDKASVVIDGVQYSPAGSVNSNYNPVASFCLGASVIPSDTSASSSYSAARFYGCKIVTGGNTVFDGIPVRKGNAAYIYDRVSGRMCGNAGAAGSVMTPGPDVPFDDYVEYLQSTGTQYIDTGVECGPSIGFRGTCRFEETTNSVYPVAIGAQKPDWSDFVSIYEDNGNAVIGTEADFVSVSVGTNKFYYSYRWLGDGKMGAIVGGSSNMAPSTLAPSSSIGANIGLFSAMNGDGTVSEFSKVSMYRAMFSLGQSVVRDFVPVRIGSVGYLYDRVNPTGGPLGNGLYPNSGTGDFVLGFVV